MEELFELKLGSMTMDSYEKKLLELLNYDVSRVNGYNLPTICSFLKFSREKTYTM